MISLSLHVTKEGDQFKLIWTVVEPDEIWDPPSYVVDPGRLQQAAAGVRAQLRAIAFMPPRNTAEFSSLLKKLAQRGRELFLHLMPDPINGEASELQQRLEYAAEISEKQQLDEVAEGRNDGRSDQKTSRPNLKVTLGTDELFVPWGFLFPRSKGHLPPAPSFSLRDMMGFWLSQFNITVVYGGSRSMPRKRKLNFCRVLALHEGMFVAARRILDKETSGRLDTLLESEPEPATDWDSFRNTWDRVKDDNDTVLYLYGHSDGKQIHLSDLSDDPKYALLSTSLISYRKRNSDSATLFMLNGCQTAAPAPACPYGAISANFLKETRQPGCYGFIGTEAEISNTFACQYGTEFLWRLCREGKSVGESFDELLKSDDLFPQNLLYTCYADRKFRFVQAFAAENPQ
jgi:hypothetical protein